MNEFNELFLKLQELGALEEISEQELRTWSGPTHYVSLQHVVDETNATTSLRIVSNSSLRTPGNPYSLNSILAKGPNMLTDPYKIMIRFRTYCRGLSSDVTKAYYPMFTGLLEKHVRRVVWRYGVKENKLGLWLGLSLAKMFFYNSDDDKQDDFSRMEKRVSCIALITLNLLVSNCLIRSTCLKCLSSPHIFDN